jgi:hypothetical protein
VSLANDLERVAGLAAAHAADGEGVAAVIPTEPSPGARVYLCAFEDGTGARTWLALDDGGAPLAARAAVREAVSIAGLCEVAEESAGGGDLDDLLSQLVALRLTEAPAGIEHAEEAVRELQRTIGAPPQVASPARLDAIGAATLRLEQSLGSNGGSAFSAAMRSATGAVEELAREVEAAYRLELR